eukprot:14557.XXX_775353_775496_1 [CDS] Oithona nana genome sequencing.
MTSINDRETKNGFKTRLLAVKGWGQHYGFTSGPFFAMILSLPLTSRQ